MSSIFFQKQLIDQQKLKEQEIRYLEEVLESMYFIKAYIKNYSLLDFISVHIQIAEDRLAVLKSNK